MAISVSVFFLLVQEHIGWLYTSSEDVANLVAVLMIILVFYQFGDSLQIIFANALRGVADVTSMAVVSFFGDFLYWIFRDCVTGFLYLWFRVGLGNRGNMDRLPRGLNAYRGNDVLAVLSFLAAKRYLIYISLAIKAGSLSADSSLAIDSGFTS